MSNKCPNKSAYCYRLREGRSLFRIFNFNSTVGSLEANTVSINTNQLIQLSLRKGIATEIVILLN